jgi:3-deoxy-D-manno-octulosonic-acid transferase
MNSPIGIARSASQLGSEPRRRFAERLVIAARAELTADKVEHDRRGAIWSRIYSSLWYPAIPFLLVATGGGDAQSRHERLGCVIPEADMIGAGHLRVWLHAASVGEIEGVRPVVQSLARLRPDLEFVVTTMTPTGRDAARRRLKVICQLAPFDHAAAVRAFLARIRPVLVIITETELWPNFFLESAAAGAKVALINARLSIRSMSRYRLIRPLLVSALRRASVVLAQTAEDAERFCRLGAAPERVSVTGNAKYEVIDDSPPLRPGLASFAEERPILIAGSTGPGEEQIVLSAYRDLVDRFPSLALVLAPRHLERIDEVERVLRATGLAYIRASDSNPSATPGGDPERIGARSTHSRKGENPTTPPDQGRERHKHEPRLSGAEAGRRPPQVLLLDTMGELGALYQSASIAFVGGSVTPGRGGQSLAEPANASVPVLFGPYYENHRQLGDALVAAEAGRIVRDAAQLADASAKWLTNEPARSTAGQRARSVMEQLAGSTAATVRHLCALLPAS